MPERTDGATEFAVHAFTYPPGNVHGRKPLPNTSAAVEATNTPASPPSNAF